MGLRLRDALRHRLRGLPHPTAHPEIERALVPRSHPRKRHPRRKRPRPRGPRRLSVSFVERIELALERLEPLGCGERGLSEGPRLVGAHDDALAMRATAPKQKPAT